MSRKIRTIAVGSAVALAAMASASVAQTDEFTGYVYDYYADAAMTQYQGTVADYGCGSTGPIVYVVRANVPSMYFVATPIFYCNGGGMETGG